MEWRMTDEIYDQMTELRDKKVTLPEIAKKIGYNKHTSFLSEIYKNYPRHRKSEMTLSVGDYIVDIDAQIAELTQEKENIAKLKTFIDENNLSHVNITINKKSDDLMTFPPKMVMPTENAEFSDADSPPTNDTDTSRNDSDTKSDITHEENESETPGDDLDDFLLGVTVERDEDGNITINDDLIDAIDFCFEQGLDAIQISESIDLSREEVYDIYDYEPEPEEDDNGDFQGDDV